MSIATRSFADAMKTARARREERIVLRGVSWEEYRRFVAARGYHSRVLLAYDRGDLEFMAPGYPHDVHKTRLAFLLETMAEELDLPLKCGGETLWESVEAARGLQADECYYLTAAKLEAANIVWRRTPRPNDSEDYPMPDLAVEIDISRSKVDRPGIYATLGVPEVWRFDGKSLRIDRLQGDGKYAEVAESLFFPIRPDELAGWILEECFDDTPWRRRARDWVRAVVVPRRPANP